MNRGIYKLEIGLLKVIPIMTAASYLLNTILSYFYIELPILSLIGGMSLFPLLFVYVSSFVFHFCSYHRMFIYYIVVSDIISYVDYHINGLPMSNRSYLLLHLIIVGLLLFIILYLKFKVCKH